MSQSTPLNQLPRENMNKSGQQNQQNSSSEMVDDILNEMSSHNEMNTESFNHIMDPSQVPPEKMEENFLNNNNSNPQDMPQNDQNTNNLEEKSDKANESFKGNMLSKLKGGNMEELFKNCLK